MQDRFAANTRNLPKLGARRQDPRLELQLAFEAFAAFERIYCFDQTLRVCRRAEQVRRFVKRFIFLEREHDDHLIPILGNDNGRVIFADTVDRARQIFSSGRIRNGLPLNSILSK